MINFIQHFPNRLEIAVIAMLTACLLPYFFAFFAKVSGGFNFKVDNANPRDFLTKAQGLPARLNAAQANSFEGLPIFLASVLVAMQFFVPQNIVNVLACFYVLLRLIYGFAYAINAPIFRSVIWILSLACCLLLFYFSLIVV